MSFIFQAMVLHRCDWSLEVINNKRKSIEHLKTFIFRILQKHHKFLFGEKITLSIF